MATGIIYCITNEYNSYCYIGSTLHEKSRLARHLRHLRKGKHVNRAMQRDFNEHGEEWFKIAVLHRDVPEDQLHLYEISEIAGARYNTGDRVYNKSRTPRLSAEARLLLALERI